MHGRRGSRLLCSSLLIIVLLAPRAEGVSSEHEKAMLQRKGVQSSRDGPEFKSEEHNNQERGAQ